MSFVWGDDNIKFLKKRYDALQASPLFRPHAVLRGPRADRQVGSADDGRARPEPENRWPTWTPIGTDVNFGEITRQFVGHLQTQPKFDLKLSSEVQDITRNKDGSWRRATRT